MATQIGAPADDDSVRFVRALAAADTVYLQAAIALPFDYTDLTFKTAPCNHNYVGSGQIATKTELARLSRVWSSSISPA